MKFPTSVLFLVIAALAISVKADTPTKTPENEPREAGDFPGRPVFLTNLPVIGGFTVELNGKITNFTKSEATNLAVPILQSLAKATHRFVVTQGSDYDFECQLTIQALQTNRFSRTNGPNSAGIFGNIAQVFTKKNTTNLATNVIASNQKQELGFRCAVDLQMIDRASRHVLAEDQGESNLTNLLEKSSDTLGFKSGSKIEGAGWEEDMLLKAACLNALKKMIDPIDESLKQWEKSKESEGNVPKDISSDSPHCFRCGTKIESGQKYCPGCGLQLFFCPSCHWSVNSNDLYCAKCGKSLPKR